MLEIAQAQQQLADLRQETWKARQESDELQRQMCRAAVAECRRPDRRPDRAGRGERRERSMP